MRGTPALLSAFLGRRHELVARVDRLLTMSPTPRRRASLTACAAAGASLVILLMPLQSVRFAEFAEFVLPHVGAAPMVWAAPVTVRLKADPTVVSTARLDAPVARGANASTFAPTSHIATVDKPNAPAMPALEARHFPGAYSAPVAPTASTFAPTSHTASADRPNRWAAPGVEIASAAKNTSVGVANVFSRAGVSLARSF